MRRCALALALVAAVSRADTPPVDAPAEAPWRAAYAGPARHDIDKVLAGPDFVERDSTLTPRLTFEWPWKSPHGAQDDDRVEPAPAWLRDLGRLAGFLAGHLLWFLLAVAILLAVRHQQRWRALFSGLRRPDARPLTAAAVSTGAVLPDTPLPGDIVAAAEACWARGDDRGALGLLYRGALAALAAQTRLELSASATEGDTLAQVRQSLPAALGDDVERLVRAWQASAYAGRRPVDFAGLVAVYRRHFAAGGRS